MSFRSMVLADSIGDRKVQSWVMVMMLMMMMMMVVVVVNRATSLRNVTLLHTDPVSE